MTIKHIAKFCLLASAFCVPATAMAADPLYVLESQTVLPSTDTDWDYMKLDEVTDRLFIARRRDGLTVFDLKTRKAVTLPNSVGANGPLLVPEFNRGYVAMTDGTLLSFDLKTLKVLDRLRLDAEGLNGAVYDPATKRVQVVTGTRAVNSAFFTIDAATGKLIGKKEFPFRKMDDPAPDGRGHLYASTRRQATILKLDSTTLEEKARWQVKDCEATVSVEYQEKTDLLVIGCRGVKPVLTAINTATGEQLATVPIGQGIDGLGIDEKRHRVVVAAGASAQLGVLQQEGAAGFRLLGNVATRPLARIMQLDSKSGKVHLITAEHTVGLPDAAGVVPTTYHPNSFVVMTYRPQ